MDTTLAPAGGRDTGGRRTAVVVGGGVSGVAAAWWLRDAGWQVTLVEQSGQLGGRVAPARMGTREITLGGKNIGRRYRRARAFVDAHGPAVYEPFGINSARVTPRGLRTIDSTRRARSVWALVRENTAVDVVRVGRWARRVARNDADRWADSPFFGSLAAGRPDAKLADALGPRMLGTLVRPITVRMNGAEPDEALLATFGSNLGTLLDTFDQLTGGFAPVLERFAATVDCRLSTRAVATSPAGDRRVVVIDGPSGRQELEADAVVLAVPADAAGPLIRDEAPELSAALETVRYFPARVVVAEYDCPVFTPEIRAVVFGADSVLSNAGAYGIDDLGTVRYTFSGRAARSDLQRDPVDLLDEAEAALGRHMPVGTARRLRYATALWERAYCAFAPRHHELALRVQAEVAPRLRVCGDFIAGASIEACFRAAERATRGLTAPALTGAGAS